jgi:hypothetical protein
MVRVVIGLVLILGGAMMLVYSRSIVERSKQQNGGRWMVPVSWRLPFIRTAAVFYLAVGMLVVYGGVRSG